MRKVLIIEDNSDIRENLEELLALEGYIVISASNGNIGIEKAQLEKPDLVLCDIGLPEKEWLPGLGNPSLHYFWLQNALCFSYWKCRRKRSYYGKAAWGRWLFD